MNAVRPTVAFWKQAFKEHGSTCVYCLEESKVAFTDTLDDYLSSSIDHLIPTAHGGANRPENIVPACVICNFYKRDHLLPESQFRQLTEKRTDGYTYVKRDSVPEYLESMRQIVRREKEKKRREFESFRRYVQEV